MPAMPRTDLTGVWDGRFTYPRSYQPTSFTCVLLDISGSLSGSVHELSNNGPSKGRTLTASVSGSATGGDVRFVKEYPPRTISHSRPVLYAGTLSTDGLEIEGEWTVPGSWSGKFLMIRSEGEAEKLEETTFEEVPFV